MKKKKKITIKEKLWRRYSDSQLSEENFKFSMGMPYDNMTPYSRWTVRGLSNDEIVTWMREVKNNAPEFIYQGLVALVEKELTNTRLEIIRNMIFRGVMAA